MFFAETWFTEASDTVIAGYQLHRRDRDGRGGGVAIYVRDGIVTSEINVAQLNSTAIEQVWRVIRVGNEALLLGCLYRPHDLNDATLTQCIASITAAQDALTGLNCASMLLYGDFNFSQTTYEPIDVGGGVATVAHVSDERPGDLRFQACLNDCHLTQLVTFPTYRKNRLEAPTTTLDLIITDDPDRAIDITASDSLGDTPMGQAHCLIAGQFAVVGPGLTQGPQHRSRLIWSKANFEALSAHITSIDWEAKLNGLSVDAAYQLLLDKFNEAVKLFIPSTTKPFFEKNERWVTPSVIEAVQAKRVLWTKYIAAGRDSHAALREQHRSACKRVAATVRRAVVDYEERLAIASKSEPKLLHAHIRSKQRVKDSIATIAVADNRTSSDPEVICSTLNNYFRSVFTVEPAGALPEFTSRTEAECDVVGNSFSTAIVQARLSCLDETKSMGLDGMHPRVLRNCSAAFAQPLALIYRMSYNLGSVPRQWLKSNVCPIFKKGSKIKASNYRPVSLTSVPCKVMESIIHEHIMTHCVAHGLITRAQHGFVEKKSCVTNLLEARDILTEAFHRGHAVDVVYTDFAKAFDKMPHKRLLHKLHAYGIRGKLLAWISAWLTGRQQRVVIDGRTSDWQDVTSGVPQGSVLGPLLFVLYINDLPDNIANQIMMYADDSKILGPIKSESDKAALQADIDQAVAWSHKWCIHFNLEKCKIMHAGRPSNRFLPLHHG